ncbi:MAG TPA: hypothetical protein IAC46_04175 [Candidatus Onthoplasma faecigallinarum]|nr:hypothetical protein [Candidatus Onthoplasma faecigallinarum]
MISLDVFRLLDLYGINYFEKIKDELSDDDYWTILRALWIDHGVCNRQWMDLIYCDRKRSHKIMKSSDRQILRRLPKKVKAYRVSYPDSNDFYKFNWTLNLDFALKYKYFRPNAFIEEKIIDKRNIFAYFNSRGEKEILLKR